MLTQSTLHNQLATIKFLMVGNFFTNRRMKVSTCYFHSLVSDFKISDGGSLKKTLNVAFAIFVFEVFFTIILLIEYPPIFIFFAEEMF